MAVKASRTVTLYKNPEVTGLVPYFKTVAAGSSAPATPSGTSPSGWSTTEPAFDNSNDLYMSIRTNYSYGDPEYSTPQKYASYEAAKVAYNEASVARSAASKMLEIINGTQISGVYTLIGTSATLDSISDGTEIKYYMPYTPAGTKQTITYDYTKSGTTTTKTDISGCTLNITLKNGTTTGAKPVIFKKITPLTTHYSSGSIIRMVYKSPYTYYVSATEYYTVTGAWVCDANYYSDSNTVDNIIPYFAGKTGSIGIWNGGLFMEDANGTYQNICTASDGTVTNAKRTTDTTKKANINGFKVGGTIYRAEKSYNANTNIADQNVIYSSRTIFDSRYSFNTKCTTTTTDAGYLVPYKQVYLVGTIDYDSDNANGLFYLDDVWWTQTPNQEGKVYILVGACYDCTSSNNRINLYEKNTWYKYNSKWKLVELQSANNQENRESYQSLSAEVATVKNTGNSLQYIVSSLKNGYYAYNQATGNFASNTTYYEFYETAYVPLTWDSSTSKYTDKAGNEYAVNDAIPNGIFLRGNWSEGLDKVVNDYYQFISTFTDQTNDAITTWFANTTIDGKNITGNINDIKTQLQSAKDMLDAYDAYIRQGIDTNPLPSPTNDTNYLTGKKYFTLSSEVYTLLIEGTDYQINDTITGSVYDSLHYGDAYIELGALSNTTMIRIYPSEVVFLTAGNRSAYLSNNNLYISESTILKKEKVGHWLTEEDSAHNLNTKWVKDQ